MVYGCLRSIALRQCRSYASHTRVLSSSALPKEMIINAVGQDRTGIVSDMTQFVTEAGGNVGESQASRLGSHFSLTMLIQVPEDKVSHLQTQLQDMTDLSASAFLISGETSKEVSQPAIAYSGHFTLEGADHPGIVHKVTSILANSGWSIEKMETSDEIAPHGGTVLFKMNGIARVYEPLRSGFESTQVCDQLTSLGDELNCDIEMKTSRSSGA